MKNNILISIATVLVVLVFSSCEDYLTEVNPNEITTESFWRNLGDCEKGLNAVYNQFRDPRVMGISEETGRSDLSFPGWGRPNTSNPYYLQMFTASSDGANNKWAALYKGIFKANQVIEGLKGIEADQTTDENKEKWTFIMAQARFFRGLFYHYLHSSFNNGSVLLFDFVPGNEEEFNQPLSEEPVIKAFLREDLEYAHQNLPLFWNGYDDSGYPLKDNDVGRVTKGAAAAVLGKSYLYEKDYTKAAEYFKEIIESGVYRLAENVGDNFTTKGEFNKESILEVSYHLTAKAEEGGSDKGTVNNYNKIISPVGGWRGIYPANWLILEYRNDPMDPNDPRNLITDTDGTTRLRSFSLRTSYSIALPDDLDLLYYGQISPDVGPFNNGECAYWRKFTNWDIVESENDINGVSGVNFRVIRLADIYLMYAECLLENGDVDGALAYINKVRHRSALLLLGSKSTGEFVESTYDEQTYSADDLMNHLMYKERPMELSPEGYAIRQLDLRRWGITKQRLEDLGSKKYWVDHYQYYSLKHKENKYKWGCLLIEEYNPDYTGRDMSEFVRSAANYVESKHAYWPIPVSETTANSKVN